MANVFDSGDFARTAIMAAPVLFFHAKILATSFSQRIRNSDVFWLAVSGIAFSVFFGYAKGWPEWPRILANAFFGILAFLGALKAYGPAYAKYSFSASLPFLFYGSVAHFIGLSIAFIFIRHALSAAWFYLRAFAFGGFFGFLRKHWNDSVKFRKSSFSWRDAARHALAFVIMVLAVRSAQFALNFESRFFESVLSLEEWSFLLIVVWMGISWLVFSVKDRMFSNRTGTAVSILAPLSAASVFVWELWWRPAGSLFFHAFWMYAVIWTIRKVLHFHSVSDGAKFVSYLDLRPGDHLEKKFLLGMLHDFQFDEPRSRELVARLGNSASPEWISEFQDFVNRARASAEERQLPGFSAKTEILVLRPSTVVPQIALAVILGIFLT